LTAFLKLCGSECPEDLRRNAQKQIDQVSVEATTYHEAGSDPDRLRAYVGSCQLCQFRTEATVRLENIEAERLRYRQNFDRAGNNESKLLSFLRTCTGSCPAELRSQAQSQLAAIEEEQQKDRDRIEAEDMANGLSSDSQSRFQSLRLIEYKSKGSRPIVGRFEQVDGRNWIDTYSRLKLREVDSPGGTDEFVDETNSTRFRVDILAKRIFKSVGKTGWVYFADMTSMDHYRRDTASTKSGGR
jgi:hypothetical protein